MELDQVKSKILSKVGDILKIKDNYYKYAKKIKNISDINLKNKYESDLGNLKRALDDFEQKALDLSKRVDDLKMEYVKDPSKAFNILFGRDMLNLINESLFIANRGLELDNKSKELFSSIDKLKIPEYDTYSTLSKFLFGVSGIIIFVTVGALMEKKKRLK